MDIMKANDDFESFLAVIFIGLLIIGGIAFLAGYEPPPKKPIEQVRQERDESFNAGGKHINSFIRGVFGKDVKTVEKIEKVGVK